MLALRGESGEVYNLGSGKQCRSGDLLDAFCRLADCQPQIVTRVKRKEYQPIADIRKMTNATGWQPEIELEQTLADVLAALKSTEA